MTARGPWLGQVRFALGASKRLGAASSVTDDTFDQVLSAPMAVVDFWSPSCPYCVEYKPIYEEVAGEQSAKILMVTANVEEANKKAGSFNIGSIPATIFLVNGKEVHRVEGNLSKQDLLGEMSKAFGSGSVIGAPQSAGSTVLKVGAVAALVAGGIYLLSRK